MLQANGYGGGMYATDHNGGGMGGGHYDNGTPPWPEGVAAAS